MKGRLWGVADGNDGLRAKGGDGDEIVMGGRWVAGGSEWTDVDDGPLKCSA